MRVQRENGFNNWWQLFFTLVLILQVIFTKPIYADFINGNFEASYIPDSTPCSPITGWAQTGYYFNGSGSSNPTNVNDINLQPSGGTNIQFCGVTDIIAGITQTLDDVFLFGATPTPTLMLPIAASQSAIINLRSINAPLTKVGTTNTVPSWTNIGAQATSLTQQMTVQNSDFDAVDGKAHIRFIAAPVLQNPAHKPEQQPFIAIQLNNLTTGRTGSNPLFFQWNYGGQPGVPWQPLTGAGTNPGSATNYQYTNLQSFDISPGNAFIHVGDVLELIVVASGCSLDGHDGHLYLDQVGVSIPSGLWVTATGPIGSTPGSNITYTYTYTNNSSSVANNVQIIASMPQQGNPGGSPPDSTTFVSVTTPTTGTSPSCSGTSPVTCNLGTLQPGQTGTFELTVNVPSGWLVSTGPVNNGNYPISATGINPLLGPLVQTNLMVPPKLSNLTVDATGLPGTAILDQTYTGTFSCSNLPISTASGDAIDASCGVTNLPQGLTQTGCTISPANTVWTQPDLIPSGQTVTCSVSGVPTTTGTVTALVTANANNNSNSTGNQVNTPITVTGVTIPATLNGSSILSPAVICCGRPVLLGELPVLGSGITSYTVTSHTGDATCFIGHSGTQTYFKMNASKGSCTIVGFKDGVMSAPFTIVTP